MAERPIASKHADVALAGGETLLGREVREALGRAGVGNRLSLAGVEGMQVTPADLKKAKLVVLAGSTEVSRAVFALIEGLDPKPAIVDATGVLEDNPESRLRAPEVDGKRSGETRLMAIAHPAAIALAVFFLQLRKAGPLRRTLVQVFEPASERGQQGIDELQQQTVGLLSFQKLKKAVYDAQVSFNLLPSYGEEAPHSLAAIELTIDRHLASLLAAVAADLPMPSLRLIQAPVFHGYSFSIWVEFEQNPGVEALAKALEAAKIEVRTSEQEPATNVGVAGQSGITVGSIAVDRNNPRAAWFWMAADNLRLVAENTAGVVREYLD